MAPDQREAEALMYNRQYIDIYSNSWGPSSKGFEVKGPGYRTQRALRDGATEVKFFRCFIADVFTKVNAALDFLKASFTLFRSQQSFILIFLFCGFQKPSLCLLPVFLVIFIIIIIIIFFLSNEVCSDLIKQPFSMLMVQQNVHIFRAAIKKAPFLSSLLEMEDFWQKTAVRTMVT